MNKGFTLIELIVVIAIVVTLSGIILFSISQYISKGKDANIAGNIAILIPAGEVYYNAENAANGDGYNGFCESSVIDNAKEQMPENPNGSCDDNPQGLCCHVEDVNNSSWVACARKFSNPDNAFCVDSRGVKKEISNTDCSAIEFTSPAQCP